MLTVREVLVRFDDDRQARSTPDTRELPVQAVVGVLGPWAGFHRAVELIGLLVIVLLTAFNGITDEHESATRFGELPLQHYWSSSLQLWR